ncbi:MAG: hypothetical protein LBT40_14965 [Deltaproteobacteria bacterium]|nr:hypothetical protein [Deltaproteobacteria bacterium]
MAVMRTAGAAGGAALLGTAVAGMTALAGKAWETAGRTGDWVRRRAGAR